MCGNLDLHFVHSSEKSYLNELDTFFDAVEAPMRNASNWPWIEAIHREARKRNVRILMTGVPGNIVFSYAGEALLEQLVRKGKWVRAMREAGALAARSSSRSMWRTLVSGGLMPLTPDWLWRTIRQRKAGWRALAAQPPWHDYSAIRVEFARAQRVDERARARGKIFAFVRRRGTGRSFSFSRRIRAAMRGGATRRCSGFRNSIRATMSDWWSFASRFRKINHCAMADRAG